MKKIIKNHPNGTNPLAISFQSNDSVTKTGVPHRELIESFKFKKWTYLKHISQK